MEGFTTGTSFAWLRATNPARDILEAFLVRAEG